MLSMWLRPVKGLLGCELRRNQGAHGFSFTSSIENGPCCVAGSEQHVKAVKTHSWGTPAGQLPLFREYILTPFTSSFLLHVSGDRERQRT